MLTKGIFLFFSFPGGMEWFIIILAFFLLFGAKKMPEMVRFITKGVKEFKKATNELKEPFNELKAPVEDFKRSINDTSHELNRKVKGTDSSLKKQSPTVNSKHSSESHRTETKIDISKDSKSI